MKKLILVRHAKADKLMHSIRDIDRPLNERGIGDAHAVAGQFKELAINPGLIISSDAVRALSTALIFARALDYPAGRIKIVPAIYEGSQSDYLQAIEEAFGESNTVTLFGHNPTISSMTARLTGREPIDLPTCSVSIMDSEKEGPVRPGAGGFILSMQLFP